MLRQVSFAKLNSQVWLSTVWRDASTSPPKRIAYCPSPVTARDAFARGDGAVAVGTIDQSAVVSLTRAVMFVRPPLARPPKRRTVAWGSLVPITAPSPATAPSGKVGGTTNGWGSQSYRVVTRGWGPAEGPAGGRPGASGAEGAPPRASVVGRP